MNIKISKEEFDELNSIVGDKSTHYMIGSKLYGTNGENSDTDILVMFDDDYPLDICFPNKHQLQYDDVNNNIQYIITSNRQFYQNLFSGDSTINFDVVLYHFTWLTNNEKLNWLRTYNIIKSFIGLAKRDIKFVKKKKSELFHVERGLYCAEELINNRLPDINHIKFLGTEKIYDDISKALDELTEKEAKLRCACNHLFEIKELTMFPKDLDMMLNGALGNRDVYSWQRKIVEANNILEFRY